MFKKFSDFSKSNPKKVLVLSWTFVFFMYLSSEAVLRGYIVKSASPTESDINSLISKLPTFIRGPIEYRQNLSNRKKDLSKALKNGDEFKIINAYLSLASMYEEKEKERTDIYQKILKKYPANIMVNSSYLALINDGEGPYSVKNLSTYLQHFPDPEEKIIIISSVWNKIKKFNTKSKKIYLDLLLKKELTNGLLFSVYDKALLDINQMGYEIKDIKKFEKLRKQSLAQLELENKRR